MNAFASAPPCSNRTFPQGDGAYQQSEGHSAHRCPCWTITKVALAILRGGLAVSSASVAVAALTKSSVLLGCASLALAASVAVLPSCNCTSRTRWQMTSTMIDIADIMLRVFVLLHPPSQNQKGRGGTTIVNSDPTVRSIYISKKPTSKKPTPPANFQNGQKPGRVQVGSGAPTGR